MIYCMRVRKQGETETTIEEIGAPNWFDAVYVAQMRWPGVHIVSWIGAYPDGKEVRA